MDTFIRRTRLLTAIAIVWIAAAGVATAQPAPYARDLKQAIDEDYTKKIREYTTEPFFTSPLVDYLPASKTVPTPKAVLGDVAGAPGKLPYAADVYKYMRMLEQASPRVKVYSIGTTEEGREMIAVAVSAEQNLGNLEENRARLARLADPRTIKMDDAEAEKLVLASVPIYYITGTIHSPETGSPTALMELAYRLAVDESPYIKAIRSGVVTLITPVVEVDGRDRQVDVYNWHLANPDKNWPPLLYWGKYVAHDNNRDAMGLTLKLTQNVLKTFLDWKAVVLHDLHESVPYLYDNTIGDGPYNAWIDPILTDEWQMIGWHNVAEMTKFGMPGVFAHGTFDTWSPGYLMFLAATHNGISRLYETFGNGGADTLDRTLSPRDTARTWYKQNPPLPKAKWSQRNNNNYQQTGLLVSLLHFSQNKNLFLRNFYLKSKRSILKARTEGPAAYVFPSDDLRPGAQAELLRILQKQGCEISRATAPFTVASPKKPARRPTTTTNESGGGPSDPQERPAQEPAEKPAAGSKDNSTNDKKKDEPETRQFPAGSYVVRMDQPYSRIADMLLDYQFWSPSDPQRTPYDDTGWTFPAVFNVQVSRVTDVKVLDAAMERVSGDVRAPGGVTGTGSVLLVNHNTDTALMTLRYRFKDVPFEVAEEPFEAGGRKFNRGSFIIRNAQGDRLTAISSAARDLGIAVHAVDAAPSVKAHAVKAPRIALMHTWQSTQSEGWWRMALDDLAVPYEYISTQDVAKDTSLNAKYDVIIFAPTRGGQGIIQGMPMYGNPIPWKTTPETPNIGKIDETDDIRPGLGWNGLDNLLQFVRRGGVFITVMGTADFAVTYGFTPGVSITRPTRLKMVGSILGAKTVDATSPIAYGYTESFAVYGDSSPIFGVSNMVGGGGGGRFAAAEGEATDRPTGRGTSDEPDAPQGRPAAEAAPVRPRVEPWEAAPIQDEQRRNGINIIPPAQRPRVVVRWADTRDLLVSGLLDAGSEIAQRPAVIDSPLDKGHVVLFSNNPVWRGETRGSYFLVFNTILNFDNLDAGRKVDQK